MPSLSNNNINHDVNDDNDDDDDKIIIIIIIIIIVMRILTTKSNTDDFVCFYAEKIAILYTHKQAKDKLPTQEKHA